MEDLTEKVPWKNDLSKIKSDSDRRRNTKSQYVLTN